MNGSHPRRTSKLAAGALGASLALGLQVGIVADAHAANPPQPGNVPHMNFGQTKLMGNVKITINTGTKLGEATIWEHEVTVCNQGSEAQPVGPDTFSATSKDYVTKFYEPHEGYLAPGLRNQWVQPGKCVTGALTSIGHKPQQMAFHDLRTDQRYDILPSTEWQGIAKVGWPRSAGTSNYYGDFNNDKIADVVGLSQGKVFNYRTGNGPRLLAGVDTGAKGLNSAYNWVGKTSDMDHNGASDLLARDASGTLWQQRMMGKGRAGFATIIGYGFGDARLMTSMNDINKDGNAELLAVRSDGRLTRQSVKSTRVSAPVQVGSNWGGMKQIFSAGDFSGDGIADLIGVHGNGNLYLYTFNSSGRITSTKQVGHNWGNIAKVVSPGDMDGDGRRDMVAVSSDGHLYFYSNNGGRWGAHRRIGTNWAGLSAIG